MQPTSREMQGLPSSSSQIPIHTFQNGNHHQPQQQQQQNQPPPHPPSSQFDQAAHDDFLDQMLSTLPSWDLLSNSNPSAAGAAPFDESILLASRLRQHQISGGSTGGAAKAMGLQLNQQQLMAPSELMPLPLSLGSGDSGREEVDAAGFKVSNPSDGLYNGFGRSFPRAAQGGVGNQQPFSHSQMFLDQGGVHASQNFGAPAVGMSQAQSASVTASGGAAAGAAAATGNGTGPPRQRVRARRGQATDPHSIAERLRRERIAERMKALQELVPNANKTDKASMLDEIIDYVKFLQLQVKVLSMSRLGGAAAVAPLVADISSDTPGRSIAGNQATAAGTSSGNDSLTVTEHQVAKLMEEDMGSAMQYLQGKGLCLMPITLASAISAATGHTRSSPGAANHHNGGILLQQQHPSFLQSNNVDGPSSPSMSVLTVQSAMATNVVPDADGSRPQAKDAASVSKP